MTTLEVRLLGQFDVKRDKATPIAIPSRPAQSLLAFLLLNPGIEHRREKLAGILWPDATEKNARSNLRHALWQLRDAIEPKRTRARAEPHLLVDDISIAFNRKSEYWLDVSVVQAAGRENASVDDVINAVHLYAGELLPGFYDDWVVPERERLRSIFEQRMTQLLERLRDEQRWKEVLEEAERWIALGQAPEAAYRALMIAHSQVGEMSQVAAVYQRCVESLRRDFDVEPSEQTRRLFEQLKSGKPIGKPETPRSERQAIRPSRESPQAKSTHAVPTNLPLSLTSFVGREQEMTQVKRLIETTRLLTLTGAGGVGKTRLALEVGAGLVERFADGVWLIELGALSDPNLVPQTVAGCLGLQEQATRSMLDTLIDHLKPKKVLLILDNCEHMIDACARFAQALLSACPHLKIVSSSRQALGVGGESVWQVPCLSLPQSQQSLAEISGTESFRLFNERAQLILPTFSVTPANADTVAAICRRLDGLPLAIELAAAGVDMQSLDEINQGMRDRFRLVTGNHRAVLPRHQTLRACLDWSWNLLSAAEQHLLRHLSVFAGTWTLADAEAVCTDEDVDRAQVLDLLGLLMRKSLAAVEARENVTRYHLLETIRYYALEKLRESGEMDRISAQHRDWYLGLAEEFDSDAREKKPTIDWMLRLGSQVDNLRAALEWSLKETGGAVKGLRLSGALGRFWEKQNTLTEGRQWLSKFLDANKDSPADSVRARALYAAGRLAHLQGDDASAITYYRGCLGIESQDIMLLAEVHLDLGMAFYRRADYESATEHYHQAIQLGETIHDAVTVALAQMRLGIIYHEQGDLERAVASHQRSLEEFRKAGDLSLAAAALSNLARVHSQRTDYEQAIEYYTKAIQTYEGLEKYYNLCINYINLSEVYIDQGNCAQASDLLAKCLQLAERLSNDYMKAVALGDVAVCKFAQGEPELALECGLGALELIRQVQAKDQEGVIYRKLGEIHAALGLGNEAQKEFQMAQSILEPLNKKSELARLYRSYGRILTAESGRATEGNSYLERALAMFQELGSTKEVENTEMLLRGVTKETSSTTL